MRTDIKEMLEGIRDGRVSVEEALLELKKSPFEDIGYAKIDTHRALRQGAAEVIYGAGKSPEQISGIVKNMRDAGCGSILITRIDEEKAQELRKAEMLKETEFEYDKTARLGIIGRKKEPDGIGKIVVVTAGTSDIPVAREAVLTAEFYGNEVMPIYDVGVAGIHRLLAHMEDIMGASVIIAIAGMEGALASVVGGLSDCPVIAVPTSVGYGAAFEGLAALLSMLNCCASGVSVVNIDNGFGAGYLASMINHMEAK